VSDRRSPTGAPAPTGRVDPHLDGVDADVRGPRDAGDRHPPGVDPGERLGTSIRDAVFTGATFDQPRRTQ